MSISRTSWRYGRASGSALLTHGFTVTKQRGAPGNPNTEHCYGPIFCPIVDGDATFKTAALAAVLELTTLRRGLNVTYG